MKLGFSKRAFRPSGSTVLVVLVAVVSLVLKVFFPESHSSNSKFPSSSINSYDEARPLFWEHIYPNGGNTLYCDKSFGSYHGKGINIEHVFPMSWAKNSLNCGTRKQCRKTSKQFNLIEADLHNLYPSLSEVNQARSSFRFGEVSGEKRHFGRCDFEVNTKYRVAEPVEKARGEIARSMFYMADRYRGQGLTLYKKQAKLLYQWHKNDPPTDKEVKRNSRIASVQGNRNPFIDTPSKLDSLYKQGHFD